MSEDWGPWIEHDGRGCPLKAGEVAKVRHVRSDGTSEEAVNPMVDHPSWWHGNFGQPVLFWGRLWVCGKITHYRIRKPRSSCEAVDRLRRIAENPQPLEEVPV